MQKLLFYDIETIPTQDERIINSISESIKPPKNYKLADTIEKWEIEQKPQLIKEKILKTAVDGAYGEIISISWAIGDGKIDGIIRNLNEPESSLISTFYAKVFSDDFDIYRFVGHNIIKFDNRFLFQRSLVNGITIPIQFITAVNARPWETEKVFDTMFQWTGSTNEYISVEKLCQAFNIRSPKTDEIDGSRVWEHIQLGNYDKVLNYNKDDVRAEREIALRMGVSV